MFSVVLVWKFLNSWLSKAQQQKLTFDKGRTWMPEVERPEFRKDAKPTERSYGKSVGGFRGIVRFWARVANDKNIKKAVTAYYCNRFYWLLLCVTSAVSPSFKDM